MYIQIFASLQLIKKNQIHTSFYQAFYYNTDTTIENTIAIQHHYLHKIADFTEISPPQLLPNLSVTRSGCLNPRGKSLMLEFDFL